jgi:enoyl-CoA hydratase
MSAAPSVIARVEGKAGRLTLNRPAALHALNLEMCVALTEALLGWRGAGGPEVVLIDHAPGTRGFCAGGDIRMLAESGAAEGPERGRAARAFFHAEYRLNHLLKTYPKPVIALMDGVTMGGGVGISVHGSHRVATPNTVFAMPETGIGLFPDVGGGWFLPRLAGELGTWLALTGVRLKGREVLSARVATHFADGGALSGLALAVCADGGAALAGLETTAPELAPGAAVVDRLFAHDRVEDIIASLVAEPGEWAAAQLGTLRTRSPQTLKVALRQLRLGRQAASFAAVMELEYRIGARVVERHDFHEGVRALLIDKDNQPRWDPATVEEVTDAMLDAIFAPLPEGEGWTPLPGLAEA